MKCCVTKSPLNLLRVVGFIGFNLKMIFAKFHIACKREVYNGYPRQLFVT